MNCLLNRRMKTESDYILLLNVLYIRKKQKKSVLPAAVLAGLVSETLVSLVIMYATLHVIKADPSPILLFPTQLVIMRGRSQL